jgi:hypothetical protein
VVGVLVSVTVTSASCEAPPTLPPHVAPLTTQPRAPALQLRFDEQLALAPPPLPAQVQP